MYIRKSEANTNKNEEKKTDNMLYFFWNCVINVRFDYGFKWNKTENSQMC